MNIIQIWELTIIQVRVPAVLRAKLAPIILKNFYLNKGFYNVQINSSFSKLLKNNEFELVYNIDSGPKIFFNDFKLNLPVDFSTENYDDIIKLFNDLRGEYYSLYSVEKILNKIENVTVEQQYESVDVDIEENIVSNKIDISFNISECGGCHCVSQIST